MVQKTLRIKLLSDLCVSGGGVYNSSLDTDVCYDVNGFPYIPGKRIRGCLRECAIELSDWGEIISDKDIFGKEDNESNGAKIRIGNAVLPESIGFSPNYNISFFHPQNILQYYTYIRTQTSINQDTGVAEDTTLRTMRVIRKGLEFVADIEIEKDAFENLKKCCAICKHMGIARTRGLGEVSLSIEDRDNKYLDNVNCLLTDNSNYLEYRITLKENVICKSVNAGESKTMDYIEGSKVLGLLAERMRESGIDYLQFMSQGKLVCSNAYIGEKDERFTEVPANLFSIKNNKKEYIDDTVYDRTTFENEQLNSMKHCYVKQIDGSIEKKNVKIEERYHHRRPEDKGIGRAASNEDNNADFYQMASICAGQEFYGFIYGSPEQVKEVYKLLNNDAQAFIGYGNSSEYGAVQINIIGSGNRNNSQKKVRTLLVKLESPTIVYNDKAFYSIDRQDLIDEVNAAIGLPKGKQPTKIFLNYVTLGGFNVTWNMRKPTIEAFDKGTVLYYEFDDTVEMNCGTMFIGERNSEGFGEILIYEPKIKNGTIPGRYRFAEENADINETHVKYVVKQDTLADGICKNLFSKFITYYVSALSFEVPDSMRPTVGNMLLMCKECDSFDQVFESTTQRYSKSTDKKKEKMQIANDIKKKAIEGYETALIQFLNEYGVEWKPESCMKKEFLYTLLTEMKYRIRQKKGAEA